MPPEEFHDDFTDAVSKLSMKLYDEFAPVRDFLAEHPEMKDDILDAYGEFFTKAFAVDFSGPHK